MNHDRSHADNRSNAVCCDSSAVTRFSFNCRYQLKPLIYFDLRAGTGSAPGKQNSSTDAPSATLRRRTTRPPARFLADSLA